MYILKRLFAAILGVLLAIPFFSCNERDGYQTRYVYAMNTNIGFYINAKGDATVLLDECEDIVYSLESMISKTVKQSEVYRLNHGESVECSPVTLELLSVARAVNGLSDGLFDLTAASAVELWSTCEKEDRLPTESELELCKSTMGMDNIKLSGSSVSLESGTVIDLGGIGKGYAEQAVAEHIEKNAAKYGVSGYMLDFGGMIAVFGEKSDGKPYRVGLRDPDGEGSRGAVALFSGYVSVSGDYERYVTVNGERYHHIIDPRTAYPGDSGVRAVAVICNNGVMADALSTACFLMGYDKALALYESKSVEFEAVFFMSDGRTLATPGADYSP